jgi:hypothetical protein
VQVQAPEGSHHRRAPRDVHAVLQRRGAHPPTFDSLHHFYRL